MADDLVIATRNLGIPSPDVVVQVVRIRRVNVVLNREGEVLFDILNEDLKVIVLAAQGDFVCDNVSTTIFGGDDDVRSELFDPAIVVMPFGQPH